jgi:CheY-like chemotaxis protein
VRLRVADNGPGMDEETRRRVFEPFFTTKEIGKGTGLGLATAYAILREHQGWIECGSAPREGATFSVYLPVAAAPVPQRQPGVRQQLLGGTETVLVIDDEEMVRSVAVRLLERAGYTVLTGRDGVEGLEVFRERQDEIGAVLLDLGMPRLGGAEVLAELHRLDPRVKAILFTGYAVEGQEYAQASAVLYKPIEWSELLRVLRQVLDS